MPQKDCPLQYNQETGERDAGDEESDAGEGGLHDRRHDDTERHRANRMSRENHHRLAAVARKAAADLNQPRARCFTARVENHRDDDRE